jgi:Bax protein
MNSATRSRWLIAGGLLLIVSLALLYVELRRDAPPDFPALTAGEPRKQAFFTYFRPLIDKANRAIAAERAELLTIASDDELSHRDLRRLKRLARKYQLDPADKQPGELITATLVRVDELPVSLILAQAAKESGWGTSRFAVSANNYFGQRCWQAGCGVKPKQRPAGATFEVASFASPYESLQSYLRNLNTHPEYAALRAIRSKVRTQGKPLRGLTLADYLGTYSEREAAYIREIKTIITANKLETPL